MTRQRMTNEAYHASDAISKTGLDLIARSPAHYRYAPRREPTRAMAIGSATHAAILEPDVYASQYVTVPTDDRRSGIWKQAVATRKEELTLTQTEGDRIVGMSEAVRSNAVLAGMLAQPGEAEVSFFATCPETGVRVRVRFDWLTDAGEAMDLKTASDARDDAFAKSVINYRYHVQQAFYADVFKWATGDTLGLWRFGVVESDAPYCVNPVRLSDDVVAYGRKLYRADLRRYADCLNSGEWPGLPGDDHVLPMPGWYVNQMEEDV